MYVDVHMMDDYVALYNVLMINSIIICKFPIYVLLIEIILINPIKMLFLYIFLMMMIVYLALERMVQHIYIHKLYVEWDLLSVWTDM